MSQTTIQDVARAAGVSVSTVSRSFTRPDLVSVTTRAKVLAVAKKLDFRLSRSAAALKSGRSFRIALLLPSPITNWFNVTVLSGLNSVLQPAGYDISIFTIATWEDRRTFFTSMPVRRNADAVILCSFNAVPDEITELRGVGVPVVGINTSRKAGLDADVSLDDIRSEELAVEHLIGLGHRRLAYFYTSHDTPFDYSADDRHVGFDNAIQAARDKGLDVHSSTIACPYEEDPVNAALAKLLALSPQPTALVFQTDDLAMPVLLHLARYNKRVPQDYSVVGFDDSTYAADAELTTLHQDPADLGRRAARLTLALMEEREGGSAGSAAQGRERSEKKTAKVSKAHARGAALPAQGLHGGEPEGSEPFQSLMAHLVLRESTAPVRPGE